MTDSGEDDDLYVPPISYLDDVPPEERAARIEALRQMTPAEKAEIVVELNRKVEALTLERIRQKYGRDLSEHEERLRLAALHLPRETMIEAFGWDPEAHR